MENQTAPPEIPQPLIKLVRLITRGFYGIEHALVMDILVHNRYIKEEDLIEKLKFERKHLRMIITQLKNDQFLKSRMRMETHSDGHTTRHNYYSVNYKMVVNVVKYKLDHMRRKIETDERDSTNRASFLCPMCGKTFTDLETDQLFDPLTGTFNCTYCQTEVQEDQSREQEKDSRTLLVRFNQQIEPVYQLLRELEDMSLPQEVLDPDLILGLIPNKTVSGGGRPGESGGSRGWADGTQRVGLDLNQEVTINMENKNAPSAALPAAEVKERPVWLRDSTVHEEELSLSSDSVKEPGIIESRPSAQQDNNDIMRVLLAHEKKGASSAVSAAIPSAGVADSDSDSSKSDTEDSNNFFGMMAQPGISSANSQEVEEMQDEDDEEEDVPMVTVGGVEYPYHQVSERPDLIAQMTSGEKEAYMKIGQQYYAHLYD
uniref:General transcription factor IIE subunit 1 n=1 Tax=Branchiostoma floridae TaxID=7739 RepID=C3Z2E0_BRAFL|eukprot:XP_002597179.1 hypothetical protein BRAFLDRAFT_260843 [Branchiostoma floridae]